MTTKKRFWSWELTGSGKIVGVVPIPDGQQPEEYTELELDRDQVIGVREFFEGHTEPLARKPAYDAKRRLLHSDYVDPTTGLSGRNQYEYDERGFLKARQELDPKQKLRFRIEVRCDDQGRIAEEKIYDHAKRLTERHTYELDDKGRVVKDVKYRADEQAPEGLYQLAYDGQGRVVQHGYHAPGGEPRAVYHYTWDDQNRRTEIALSHGGAPTFRSRFTFDAKGRRAGVEHLDGEGKAFARTTKGADGRSELWVAPPQALGPRTAALLAGKPIREVAKMTSEQMGALAILAYSHFEQGRFDQARSMYESLSTLDSGNPAYPAGAAVASLSLGDPDAAAAWYDRALGRDPKHTTSLVGKGEALLQMGKVKEALDLFGLAFQSAKSKDDPAIRRAQLIATAISQAAKPARPPAKPQGKATR